MALSLSLSGKIALVTGGSRGIGAETVRLFCESGARVAFSYRQARTQADVLAAECGGPAQCVAINQDLSSAADGRTLVEKVVAAFGRLDILVANHGVWPDEDVPFAQMTDAQWRRTLAAVVQMERQMTQERRPATESAPHGRDATGHIVLISSTAGLRGEAYHADYAVTKGALISLTKSLSSELAPRGIRVNCVAPGWVATDMSAATLTDPATGPKIEAAIPLRRVATPREIAGPVVFLCTPLAGFISGEVLNVNGGSVLVG